MKRLVRGLGLALTAIIVIRALDLLLGGRCSVSDSSMSS